MDSPKCKICGERHYGLCNVKAAPIAVAKIAVPIPREKLLQPHHQSWLSMHPNRTRDWLVARLAEGFHVHHLNGDEGNNHPENLLLIEGGDHLRLHRKIMPVLNGKPQEFDRTAYQREYMRKRRAAQKEKK